MARLLCIAAAQVMPVAGDPAASLRKLEEVTLGVVDSVPWVDLICFPELFVTGLHQFVKNESKPSEMAWEIPGPMTRRLGELARRAGKWLVPGSFFERAGEAIYNSSVVFSPQGDVVAHYRKLYPWRPLERTAAGDLGFCVFDVPEVGRLGLCICYDMWFPEVARTLAWMGAEVILHPSMTSTSDREAETVMARANAIFNQCYFVDVNVVGLYGGGRSQIIDPDGNVLQMATEHEAILTQILDLEHVSRTRELGTMGLSQAWKAWRDTALSFPPYSEPAENSPTLRALGDVHYPDTLHSGA